MKLSMPGILLGLLIIGCSTEQADVVYTNGRIYTVNEAQPWAEAVAIRDGKFIAVGSAADVEAVTGDGTEVIDLEGGFAIILDPFKYPPLCFGVDAGIIVVRQSPCGCSYKSLENSKRSLGFSNIIRIFL